MTENQTRNYEELSDIALKELFEYIAEWAEKYENEGLEIQGLANFAMFDPEGECTGGMYNTNISDMETYTNMQEAVVKQIEENEEDLEYEAFEGEEADSDDDVR